MPISTIIASSRLGVKQLKLLFKTERGHLGYLKIWWVIERILIDGYISHRHQTGSNSKSNLQINGEYWGMLYTTGVQNHPVGKESNYLQLLLTLFVVTRGILCQRSSTYSNKWPSWPHTWFPNFPG